MINANLDTFIDYEWEHGVTLFYNGYIYFCSGGFKPDWKTFSYGVFRQRAENENNLYYREYMENDKPVDYEKVFEVAGDYDDVKKKFFSAHIFDGKSFWEVEKEIAWLEQGEPIIIDSGDQVT